MLDNEDGQDCPIGSTRISLRNDAKRMAEPARDRITLVLNGNQTGRYMPMNAWILAHRFGHAIQLRDKNEPETFVLDPTIFAEFEKIYNAVCIQFPITFPVFRTSLFAGGNTATDYFRCFVETLCTMRSARQGIITHIGEVMPELLAQYLISGGVRFNRVGLWDYNRFALAQPDFRGWRPISMSIRPIDKIDVASVDEMIENAEVVINKAFRDYLDSLVGKMVNYVIAHIPHASIEVPFREHYSGDVDAELALVTDWATDQMVKADESVIFPFSRLWCDVERFIDDPLNKCGLGMFYTHRLNGEPLREVKQPYLDRATTDYVTHHNKVVKAITSAISLMPVCLLDVHSYSEQQAELMGHSAPYPEICLGYDDGALPPGLVSAVSSVFQNAGYSVSNNQPYQGALLPTVFEGHPYFFALMIEVNKSVYLTAENVIIANRFARLQGAMNAVVDIIRDFPTGA
ncbi:unnamed protein product [Sphagnum tenellum]